MLQSATGKVLQRMTELQELRPVLGECGVAIEK